MTPSIQTNRGSVVRVAAFALATLAAEAAWAMNIGGSLWHGVIGIASILIAVLWLLALAQSARWGRLTVLLALAASAPLLLANVWLLVLFQSCARGACF